jgi:hypothetical protein
MMNSLILNTLNDDSLYTNNLLMKTFVQLFIENNAFIMNNGLLKSNILINELIGLLRNSRIHIEFYSKFFLMTEHGLIS